MAYAITRFGGVTLPHKMSTDDLGSGSIEPGLVLSMGGTFDVYGGDRRVPRRRFLRHTGMYTGADAADLQSQIDALKSAVGTADLLWRRRHDAIEHWARARLLSVEHEAEVADHAANVADITASFELDGAYWRSSAPLVVAAGLADGANTIALANGGLAVGDAAISLAFSGSVSTVDLAIGGGHLTLAGTYGGGDVLAIDCGDLTVRLNGTDSYDDFAIGGGHTIDGWLSIPPGGGDLAVTINGYADLEVSYYERFA